VSRYPDAPKSLFPLPRVGADLPEEECDPASVTAPQTLIGEFLCVSTKTRPDLAYDVSWMGSRATKNPKKVVQLGSQMIGYLRDSCEVGLLYKREIDGDQHPEILAFPRSATFCAWGSKIPTGSSGVLCSGKALPLSVL
jgi:hypothetical protein